MEEKKTSYFGTGVSDKMGKQNNQKEEKERVRGLKEERISREKEEGKHKGIGERIRRKWKKFLLQRDIEKKIKRREKEHGKERKKKIVPNKGFGD